MATEWIPTKKRPKRRYKWVYSGEVAEWVDMMDNGGMTSREVAEDVDRSVYTIRRYTQKYRREHRQD